MPSIKPVPVIVNTKGFNYDLSEQAQIATNYAALSEAIATNPGRFAVWAVLEANARKVYDALVSKLEILEATLFEQYRMPMDDGKYPPVDAVKARVTANPERVILVDEVNEAKSNLELLTVGRRTIEQRKDSLLAIASNYRAEINGRIQVNLSPQQRAELDDRARGSRGPVPPRRTPTPGPTAA